MDGQNKFPILCETCLGENPFIRMTKEPYGKACKICDRPFTVFRWRPGPRARFKKTEICQTCSKMKNVCQTCVLDLQFGLPVQVRDQALDEGDRIEVPKSTVNRDYQSEQYERQVNDAITAGENGEPGLIGYGKAKNNKMLSRLARRTPYYQRNRPHICSFYVKGACTRGEECPFRHETPITGELANQNIKDRFYGVNDPVANKMMREHGERIQKDIEAGVGDANAYTRDNSRHFARLAAAGSNGKPGPPRVDRRTGPNAPPENQAIVSLFVGGVDSRFTEDELKGLFSPYGEIASVNMKPEKAFAFVEYKERSAAETAVKATWNSLSLHGQKLRVDWSKAAPRPKPKPAAPSKPLYAPPPGMKSAMQFRPPPQPLGFQPPPPSSAAPQPSSSSSSSSSARGAQNNDPTRHLQFPPPPERPRPPPQAFARMAPPPGAGGKSLGGSGRYASMNPNSFTASFDDEDARRDR